MKTRIFLASALASVAGFAAAPQATVTGLSLDSDSGFVTVDYTLTEPAVVTVDFQFKDAGGDWASADAARVQALSGDVNRRVSAVPGQACRLSWQAFGDGFGQRLAAGAFRAVLKAWPLAAPPPYMAIDLVARETVRYYASSNAVPGGVMDPKYRQSVLLMRKIPAANREWRMGLPLGEWRATYGGARETAHLVKLTADFYIAVFPLTQQQLSSHHWNGSEFRARDDWQMRPADKLLYGELRGSPSDTPPVNWPLTGDEPVGGILKKFRDYTGVRLDLPLDAQHEFACRAGAETQLYTGVPSIGNRPEELDKIAWTKQNSGGETHVVGLLQPNAFGLYDMIGNVRCRCRDWYVEDLTTLRDKAYLDPKGAETNEGGNRVSRGCKYNEEYMAARCSYRAPDWHGSEAPGLGTRFVCPALAEK